MEDSEHSTLGRRRPDVFLISQVLSEGHSFYRAPQKIAQKLASYYYGVYFYKDTCRGAEESVRSNQA